jgi:hypothetical protein
VIGYVKDGNDNGQLSLTTNSLNASSLNTTTNNKSNSIGLNAGVVLRLMLVAVRLVLWWVVCWLLLVLEPREMLPLKPPEFVPYTV